MGVVLSVLECAAANKAFNYKDSGAIKSREVRDLEGRAQSREAGM